MKEAFNEIPGDEAFSGRDERLEILRARAEALARESVQEQPDEECLDIVEFLLCEERYGIDCEHVHKVHRLRDLTEVPCTQAFVLGIINVHGEIFSVIDLRKLFDLPLEALTDLNRVIVLRSDEMEFGILADAILGRRSVPRKEIMPALPTLTGIGADYLLGITEDRVIILDGSKILADPRVVVDEDLDPELKQHHS